MREFEPKFVAAYGKMGRGAFLKDRSQILEAGRDLEFLQPEDKEEWLEGFCEICEYYLEPFVSESGEEYDWGKSDLLKRAATKGAQVAFSFRLRPPPSEVVYLDRKFGGIFITLSVLNVRANCRGLLKKYLISGV